MRWAEGFIAVDWGTTNRRAYRIEPDGGMSGEMEDDQGILSVPPGEFPSALHAINEKLGKKPMLLAGMIGSNRGWVEAPYVPCPAGLHDLAERLIWAEPDHVAIIPGLSYLSDDRADVMRGEEVQVIGAIDSGLIPKDCLVCHPGTHNKWIEIVDGKIACFQTVMTGELFNLLREHSILSDLLVKPAAPDKAFLKGVRRGLSHDGLTAELFSIRARVLLKQAERSDAASFTSGLLIGSDLRVGLRVAPEDQVIVMGRPELTSLYSAALVEAGYESREIDGEKAFLAGIKKIAEIMS